MVYQIYPRSFADSNGDGVGDIAGIIAHLDYLQQLGVDVVWLSPVYRSPQDDNGYDISDYQDVDPVFGSLTDLDELITGLHRRGMKLIMDLVVNHTSDEHPWFIESGDPTSSKRDWYWWRPARAGSQPGTHGAEPTNWGSYFSGPAWAYDPRSGEYYLHLFSRKQPDLNWENPNVRQAVYRMMNWWVDRGVDGFRMDVINLISKTLPLADGRITDPRIGLSYDRRLVTDGPRVHEFLREMHDAVGFTAKQLFTVGEMVRIDLERARDYVDPANRELIMVFAFEHLSLDRDGHGNKYSATRLHLPDLKENLATWQYGMADRGWNSLFWENHDQPRSVSRFGDDSPEFRVASAKTLATVLHLLKGTPYIYQGEEIGMTNAGFTRVEQYLDIEALRWVDEMRGLGVPEEELLRVLAAKSRDNARTPMQWDDSPQAGFTTGQPWLPVTPNYRHINAAAAVADPASVFHHYRRLIAMRHERLVVRAGRFDLLLPDHEQLFAYTRTLGAEQLLVLANMSSQVVTLPVTGLPDTAQAQVLLATHDDGSPLVLQPWESRVYQL